MCTFSAQSKLLSLQPHLREKTRELLAKTIKRIVPDKAIEDAYDALLEDVNTVEREWNLV